MATKKDLAFDHFMTAGNPVKKRKAPAKRREKNSEIPLKRARYTTSTEKGMVDLKIDLFGRKNNPISSSDIKLSDIERLKYFVQEKTASGWLSLAAFHELDDAKEFATLISESGNVPIRVAA